MATRAVSTVVTYRAWDTSANAPKTGDVANHTLRWIKDGTSAAPTNAATAAEVDATNAPGVYKLTLTSTETDCTFGVLAGKSGTANIQIFGCQIGFEYVPTSATTFGAFIGNSTAAIAVDGSGDVTFNNTSIATVTNLTNLPSIPANWLTATGIAASALNGKGDWNVGKTGYSLTQTFPTNFSSLAITVGGAVTAGTVSDKTGYTVSTVSDKTGYALTAAYDLAKTAAQAGSSMDITSINGDTTAAANLAKTTRAIARGTVTTGASTTSIPTSAFSPSGSAADQFKGRIVTFDADTTTAALRGQSTDITASTSAATPTLTVTALTSAPASGDTFSVT